MATITSSANRPTQKRICNADGYHATLAARELCDRYNQMLSSAPMSDRRVSA